MSYDLFTELFKNAYWGDLSSHILMSTSVLEPLQQLRVVGVTASSFQDPNIPQNVLDADDLSTRFSVEGKGQWLEFDFGGEQDVSGIDVAFFKGSERFQNFEIFTSDGNTTIAKVAAAKSSGQTNSPERYDLPQSIKASHLRFVNQGNTQNDWFSILALRVYGKQLTVVGDGNGGNGEPQDGELDSDGIKILSEIDNNGFSTNLTKVDFSRSGGLVEHDCKNDKAEKKTEGNLTFWRMISRKGRFQSSGDPNWTARPTFISSRKNTPKGVDGARDRGFLAEENDPKNQEFTAIARVKKIEEDDFEEEGDYGYDDYLDDYKGEHFALKIRGSVHNDTEEKTLTCEGLYPYARKRRELTSVEITHPNYRFEKVRFVPPFNQEDQNPPFPGENWIGLKLICYNINENRYHMDFYIDPEPIDFGTGKFNNSWQKVWEYEESEDDTPVWGGPRCTLRVDMVERLDVAAMNVRSIKVPSP